MVLMAWRFLRIARARKRKRIVQQAIIRIRLRAYQVMPMNMICEMAPLPISVL